ncbi:MAG: SpoIIE family protein phosphatase [Candidatus Nanopelagicales bacterium]
MTLKSRVTVVAAVTFVLLTFISAFTANRYLAAQSSGTEIVSKLEPAAANASKLLLSTADMERGIRSYVATQRAASLSPYAEGSNVSEAAVEELEALLSGTDPVLERQVERVAKARTDWIESVATPTIALVRSGQPEAAEVLLDSTASMRNFELLRARATALNTQIDSRLAAQFANFGNLANSLGVVLIASGLLIIVGLVLLWWLLRRWVLRPLRQLGAQLRHVTGDDGNKNAEIFPIGPPEIAQVATDAEDMRQRLVRETENVHRAYESFDSEEPVVIALRAELSREPHVFAVGLNIYGEMESSESEVAGDWWDAVALPDGRTAVIITDISGHGPQAGIAGLRLKLALIGMLEAGSSLVSAFDRGVKLFADTPSRFATAAAVAIDPRTHELEWVNAGHLPPLVISPNGVARELTITGPLLSALGGNWTSSRTTVAPNDIVVMWTDGITESRDAAGDELEVSGLTAIITAAQTNAQVEPVQLVRKVLAAGRARSVNWGNDDRTLVIAAFDDARVSDN